MSPATTATAVHSVAIATTTQVPQKQPQSASMEDRRVPHVDSRLVLFLGMLREISIWT